MNLKSTGSRPPLSLCSNLDGTCNSAADSKKIKKIARDIFFDKTELTAVNALQQKPVCKRYSNIAICVPRIAEMSASGFRHF